VSLRKRLLRGWISLVRPFTLLAPTFGTFAAAVVAAAALDRALPLKSLGGALLAAVLATAASNAWNQVFDVAIDRQNKPTRPIPQGLVSARAALLGGHLFAVLALLVGAGVSWSFLACIGAGLLGTWIYSAPPLRTKRGTLAALLTIAVPRGLLVPVAGWSVVAPPTATDPWALGTVAFLYVFGAAATKDFADVAGDREHGCRTLPVRVGPRRAARLVAPFLVLPFLLLPFFQAAGWLRPSLASFLVLAGVLVLAGGGTARSLLKDPDGLASGRKGHPAWIGMYLTLLLYQLGSALVYVIRS